MLFARMALAALPESAREEVREGATADGVSPHLAVEGTWRHFKKAKPTSHASQVTARPNT